MAHAWVVGGHAECLQAGCRWATMGKNVLGNAARHANATGHRVGAGIEYGVGPSRGQKEERA